jgi:hypothetical protein
MAVIRGVEIAFIKKNAHLLLVFYLHESGVDPRDFAIKIVRIWDFPPEDLEIIRQDWEDRRQGSSRSRARALGGRHPVPRCGDQELGFLRRRAANSTTPASRALSL